MSEDLTKTAPIVVDAFGKFWQSHPIHQSGLDDEALAKFRDFAANIWNNARFDLGMKQIEAMDKLCSIGINPQIHPTLDSCVDAAVRMVENLRKDLRCGIDERILVDAIIGSGLTIDTGTEMQSKGLARFTGNQHNPEWTWDRKALGEICQSELIAIYEKVRMVANLRKDLANTKALAAPTENEDEN